MCVHQATFNYSAIVLAKCRRSSWSENSNSYAHLYERGLRNYILLWVTLVQGKVTEQMILSVTTWHKQRYQAIRPSLGSVLTLQKPCPNLIPPHVSMSSLADEGKAVDVVYMDCSNTFDTISPSILLGKLPVHSLDSCTALWIRLKNSAMDRPKGLKSIHKWYSPELSTGISFGLYSYQQCSRRGLRAP